jgi:hypothetical protein
MRIFEESESISMKSGTVSERDSVNQHRILKRKMLMYGLISSVVGFPIGLVLNLPAVWGLALLGIFIGALKLYMSDVE